MAHAGMSGIFRVAGREPAAVRPEGVDLGVLVQPEEADLLKELAAFPGIVARAAETLEPHRVTGYLEGLARLAHAWYHKYRVLGEPEERERLSTAREAAPGGSPRHRCGRGVGVGAGLVMW